MPVIHTRDGGRITIEKPRTPQHRHIWLVIDRGVRNVEIPLEEDELACLHRVLGEALNLIRTGSPFGMQEE